MRVASGSTACDWEGQIPLPGQKMVRSARSMARLARSSNRLAHPGRQHRQAVLCAPKPTWGTGRVSISSAARGAGPSSRLARPGALERTLQPLTRTGGVGGSRRMPACLLQICVEGLARPCFAQPATVAPRRSPGGRFPGSPVQCRPLKRSRPLPEHRLAGVHQHGRQSRPIIDQARCSSLNRRSSLNAGRIGVPRKCSSGSAVLRAWKSLMSTTLQEVVNATRITREDRRARPRVLLQERPEQFLEWWDGLKAVPTLNDCARPWR